MLENKVNKGISLESALKLVRENSDKVYGSVTQPFECVIDPNEIDADSLHDFAHFNIELVLRKNSDGRFILSTGSAMYGSAEYGEVDTPDEAIGVLGANTLFKEQIENSFFVLHNHPGTTIRDQEDGGKIQCSPSIVDMVTATVNFKNKVNVVLSQFGICFYRGLQSKPGVKGLHDLLVNSGIKLDRVSVHAALLQLFSDDDISKSYGELVKHGLVSEKIEFGHENFELLIKYLSGKLQEEDLLKKVF